jgi:hypothetical protein
MESIAITVSVSLCGWSALLPPPLMIKKCDKSVGAEAALACRVRFALMSVLSLNPQRQWACDAGPRGENFSCPTASRFFSCSRPVGVYGMS